MMRSYPQPRVAAISSGKRTRPRVLAMASSPSRTFEFYFLLSPSAFISPFPIRRALMID